MKEEGKSCSSKVGLHPSTPVGFPLSSWCSSNLSGLGSELSSPSPLSRWVAKHRSFTTVAGLATESCSGADGYPFICSAGESPKPHKACIGDTRIDLKAFKLQGCTFSNGPSLNPVMGPILRKSDFPLTSVHLCAAGVSRRGSVIFMSRSPRR